MSEIGSKKWGEVYKRVLVLQRDSVNLGLVSDPLPIESGDGVGSPLLMGSNIVGISGNKKFFFGDQTLYLRKLRANVIEVGVPGMMVVRGISALLGVSALILQAEELFAEGIEASNILVKNLSFIKMGGTEIEVSSLTSDVADIKQVNTDVLSTKEVYASNVNAKSMSFDNIDAGIGEFCEVHANTKVAAPSVSAVSLQGCSNMIAWW